MEARLSLLKTTNMYADKVQTTILNLLAGLSNVLTLNAQHALEMITRMRLIL